MIMWKTLSKQGYCNFVNKRLHWSTSQASLFKRKILTRMTRFSSSSLHQSFFTTGRSLH